MGGFLFQVAKRKSFCHLAVGGHTFRLRGVLKKTVIHKLKRAEFTTCQNGRKHRGSMKRGPCSWHSWQPLAPSLARSAVLGAARVTDTGPWEQEDSSGALEKISVLRASLGSGCFCAACKSQGLRFLKVLLRCVPARQSGTCQGGPCLLPGTAGSVAWIAPSSWGTALLSDPCFAIWLLRIGVTMQSFLREICCSVHQEFWLGVSSNSGLTNNLKVLNNLRARFPKGILQIPWLRYRRLLEQVLCFKPQSR